MKPPIDLADYDWKLSVRPMRITDYEQLVEMQTLCFPGMKTWARQQIESQLEKFPEGQIVVESEGRVVASSSSLILAYDPALEWHNWQAVADNGFIRNHNPRGDTLYGIEIMVHPEYRGLKLARRMYAARKNLCREKNLARIVIAGRIPGYREKSAEMSPSEYVDAVMNKSVFDPVLTAQVSNGFSVQAIIENYFPSDKESAGYATFLEWLNLSYQPSPTRRFQHPTEPVRLCVVQYQMRRISSFDEFAQQVEFFVDTASDYRCDFVLFPELFTTQLLSLVHAPRPGTAARELAVFTPKYLEVLASLAVKYDVNIIGGSQFVIEGDQLYNISFLFRRDGSIEKQYKIHITPSERKWWGVTGGNRMEVFDTDCGRIAIQICYDIQFPELTRISTQKGARLIFVPYNTDTRHGYLRVRRCAQARCVENHVYVAISGCTGNLPFVENADIHYAQSGIFTPADVNFARDAVAAECNPNVETVIIHDLDLEQLRRHTENGSVTNWNDRRNDLYRVLYEEDKLNREI